MTQKETERGRDQLRVECWARSLARTPEGPQAHVVERLEWLEADGDLDDLVVEHWPAAVPEDPTWTIGAHERTVRERLGEFEAWADRTARDLGPAFDSRQVGNRYTAPAVDVVRVLPVVALAEYRGEELRMVSPSVADGEVYRVEDHLADLAGTGAATRRTRALPADD